MSGEPVISGWLNGDSISLNTDTEDYLTVLYSAVDGELLQADLRYTFMHAESVILTECI